MSKPLFVISCPYDTYSGYGARSRDLVKAIIETDKYDVKLLSQRWGNTPFGFCDDNPEWSFLNNSMLPGNQLPKQPEIWAQITVPNEFQPIGKYNIGFTAGIESTVCPPEWIEGVNRMNLTIVSSEHSKKVFQESTFEKRNQHTNVVEGMVKLEKPIEVLFEGCDTNVYKVIESHKTKSIDLNSIKEQFCYLFVGHWMDGDLGEDRKNVGLLVKAFLETFKNKQNKPALILKTSQVGSSYMDREAILHKIKKIKQTVNSKNLPNVYLLHGEFTDEEMNELYNNPKVKAMVSLTKGEGFGRPLLEFTLSKKPLITTNWSGHVDFLNIEFTNLIGGTLTPVHPSTRNQFLINDSLWFSPDPAQIGFYLKDVFENYKNYTEKAKRQAFKSKNEFSWEKMKEKTDELLTKYIPEFPKQVELKLPQLKKIELPQLKKIELPKLQKIESNG
jgi:glycosyltransferase involved in cell wall biosynthesis